MGLGRFISASKTMLAACLRNSLASGIVTFPCGCKRLPSCVRDPSFLGNFVLMEVRGLVSPDHALTAK